MNINDISKQAIELQSAVNVQALVRSWSEWMPTIRAHAEALKIDFNQHPVNVLMASKMVSLTRCEVDLIFLTAYDQAQVWAALTTAS